MESQRKMSVNDFLFLLTYKIVVRLQDMRQKVMEKRSANRLYTISIFLSIGGLWESENGSTLSVTDMVLSFAES